MCAAIVTQDVLDLKTETQAAPNVLDVRRRLRWPERIAATQVRDAIARVHELHGTPM